MTIGASFCSPDDRLDIVMRPFLLHQHSVASAPQLHAGKQAEALQ